MLKFVFNIGSGDSHVRRVILTNGLLACLVITGCDTTEDIIDGQQFVYRIDGCTNSNPELNACIQFVRFKSDGKVDYLPHGDIIYEGTYATAGKTIKVYASDKVFVINTSLIYEFTIKSDDELTQEPQKEKWVREAL